MRRKKIKQPSRYEESMVERINSHPISPDLMFGLAEKITALEPGDRGFEAHACVTIAFFDGHENHRDLSFSALFRLEALARIIYEGKLPGWTQESHPDRGVLTHAALFAAAGQAPVVYRNGNIRFNRKKLLQAVFQHAKKLRSS